MHIINIDILIKNIGYFIKYFSFNKIINSISLSMFLYRMVQEDNKRYAIILNTDFYNRIQYFIQDKVETL